MYYNESGAKTFLISFFTALVVSGIVSFSFWYFSPTFTRAKSEKVEVPNLKGIDVETARTLLDSKGVSLVVEKRINSDMVESGKIIYQDPLPGTEIKKGDIIKIVESLGPKAVKPNEIIVPDVTGMSLNQGRVLLAEKGLVVGNIKKKVSDKPEDTIINTTPEPGKKVTPNFKIDIIVSGGPGSVTIPRITGLSLPAASRKLNNLGLEIGNVSYTTDTEHNFDVIIRQNPRSGSTVKKGSKVNVVINREAVTE